VGALEGTASMTTETTLILKPSPIQGVGVFTLRKIKKGEKVDLWHSRDYKFRKSCSRAERRYCIKDKHGWHGPLDFHRMSIGWYLNHSESPRLSVPDYRALQNIERGQELTINYRHLAEP
jgi:hypothetical protein